MMNPYAPVTYKTQAMRHAAEREEVLKDLIRSLDHTIEDLVRQQDGHKQKLKVVCAMLLAGAEKEP